MYFTVRELLLLLKHVTFIIKFCKWKSYIRAIVPNTTLENLSDEKFSLHEFVEKEKSI